MPEDRTNKVSCSSYTYELEVAFEILSGKWVPQIIWNLAKGEKRFGQLRKLMPKITQKMLTQQLRSLEKNGIINRTAYPEVPPVVEYSLTEIGKKLIPSFDSLNDWAVEYLQNRDA
ncbi:helix-turn-helix domain-containing protein [Halodesulfovibrio sp.]|jgi:DNA-binding HxlR family transcriptional regulator|uniref:winged helix-turn-helix transcriptional regulator n=1 Tax=Halodesulfovibrio sp. TaxID=1912772 RepID=UPI0025FA8B95|nr:helix-turn-helix domain-containing protein [Halodesulfovibrio sp.]MCT4534086.1 helix-turn-helix transcriptional regulator [Halodesulfovibrio sp.]MCT4626951.1 helix-turn-helix transcriptional regulator [Halodesulfovibrio sp.]